MTEPDLISRERTLLQELFRLSAERALAENAAEQEFQTRVAALEAGIQQSRESLRATFENQRTAAEQQYQEAQRGLSARFQSDYTACQKEYQALRERLDLDHEQEKETAEKEQKEAVWSANTVFEANRHQIDDSLKEVEERTAEALAEVPEIQKTADDLLDEWNQEVEFDKANVAFKAPKGIEAQLRRIRDKVEESNEYLEALQKLSVPKLFKGERLLGLFIVGWLVVIALLAVGLWVAAVQGWVPVYASGWPKGWYIWLGGATGVTALICVLIRFWLANKAHDQVAALYEPLCRALIEARLVAKKTQEEAAERHPRLHAENKEKQQKELRKVAEKFARKSEAIKQRFDGEFKQIDVKYPKGLAEIQQRRDADLKQINARFPPLLNELKQKFEAESSQVQQQFEQNSAAAKQRYQAARQALAKAWNEGLAHANELFGAVEDEAGRLFSDWAEIDWNTWQPPKAIPPALRFGVLTVDRNQIPGSKPKDVEQCEELPESFTLPALLPFPNGGSLVLRAADDGRALAVHALQAVMLRYLTSLPPGKVRFTIIDPVGLGENFASFMHLADADEALVNNRIWTEPGHIEQRLADLTEHMETVIQKYLRNQFSSIAEYNEQAGEVAEPYRVLVVANFPVNFSEAAARRLVSIAASGAGCGVYVLSSVDTKQQLPPNFQLRDLEQAATALSWKETGFVWRDTDFGRFPLQLDTLPADDVCNRIFTIVGEQARLANKVEVPFELIAPTNDGWWNSDSRAGIRVPLGRAGATKFQFLDLGKGTSQHVLVAGKTGSGKSTLLHALITNLALYYSPREVEFYLIDFKKGVEFKTYAALGLPHARVVAIESEREFGLSVLQRLDVELRERGERFRAAGVQDLNAYRQDHPDEAVPRILLIVDEFQEFFTEDDKISQEVALLLDRLVRQGRAFGIHVLLGSQTLGGAYSLARSTLGQMAVRIALQCSESDAGLILSEDNTAARLLSRPGEAIYNDANGRVEGNDFFQVVWLPDERREQYLQKIHDLAMRKGLLPDRPQIVFEGNTPAEIEKNHLLQKSLETPLPSGERGRGEGGKSAQAWLGEAIAIKDPTAAVFRPQSGSNLLVLGQQEESSLSLMAASLLSLAAQHRGQPDTRFYILDGTPVDDAHAGYLPKLAEMLPFSVKAGGYRETAALMAEIAAELERRQQANDFDTPMYIFVHALQRFRDLRRAEDDFGFGSGDKPPTPAQQFATLLREGPPLGIYTLVWCDSLTNANRALDRQGLREFEMKVLFQMSATDSGMLIDSPAASKLGLHRALFHAEERGQPEKFRPYGLPGADWLTWVKDHLRAGNSPLSPLGERGRG